MSCCGSGPVCGSGNRMPAESENANYCKQSDICCFLYKTMTDPCSKALDRNIRRLVYGQIDHCGCRPTVETCCPRNASCGIGCPRPDPRSCPKPVVVQFKCPTMQCPMPPRDGDNGNGGCN